MTERQTDKDRGRMGTRGERETDRLMTERQTDKDRGRMGTRGETDRLMTERQTDKDRGRMGTRGERQTDRLMTERERERQTKRENGNKRGETDRQRDNKLPLATWLPLIFTLNPHVPRHKNDNTECLARKPTSRSRTGYLYLYVTVTRS